MVMSSQVSARGSSVRSSGGRMILLGTGRVKSEMTTQALFLPRATSSREGLLMGFERADETAIPGSAIAFERFHPKMLNRRRQFQDQRFFRHTAFSILEPIGFPLSL
jgi:hypothetical protein